MDKILIKTVTKTLTTKIKTTKTYYSQIASRKATLSKQPFIPLLRTSEQNTRNNERHKEADER